MWLGNIYPTMLPQFRAHRNKLVAYNLAVADMCETKLGITLHMYRTIEQIMYLGAVILGMLAVSEGADPLLTTAIVAFIISGPAALEYLLVREDYVEYEQLQQNQDDE